MRCHQNGGRDARPTVTSDQWLVISYQLQVIGHKLKYLEANWQEMLTSHCLLLTESGSGPKLKYWLLATGYWLLVTGYRLLFQSQDFTHLYRFPAAFDCHCAAVAYQHAGVRRTQGSTAGYDGPP